jgi:glycosyltransferase involved in cell wall biosynthesis
MSVLYLLTSPPPLIEGADAVFQEVASLREAFPSELMNLCPRRTPGAPFPPQLLGFHLLPALRRAERRCRITHLYFSVPYLFPVLRFLRNPVVYTVVASLGGREAPGHIDRLGALHRIVVSNRRDADILKSWGLENVAIVAPAVDAPQLKAERLELGAETTLLMASAPWTEEQFDTKGVDALLQAASRDRSIRLILLWRGQFLDALKDRIAKLGIADRVEIVPERVDIGGYLRRAHATVLLAKKSDIVKAYPNSLIESLLAGKPVVLTEALPMADYVQERGCGVVVRDVSQTTILEAIEALRERYQELAKSARTVGAAEFSKGSLVETYRVIYGL